MMSPIELPSIPRDQFLGAMRNLPGAVTVVTTLVNGERVGFTATAVCSLSADPPQLLVCVNRSSRSFAALSQSDCLAINVLADQDRDIAERFARLPQEERFAGLDWRVLETGAPVLDHAVVAFDCQKERVMDHDSHAIFCGRVVSTHSSDANPLLYVRQSYMSLAALSNSGGANK